MERLGCFSLQISPKQVKKLVWLNTMPGVSIQDKSDKGVFLKIEVVVFVNV